MSVETGMELALTDTVQVTKENQISTGDGPPSAEWQMEIPTVQEKIGVTPHTLHERRPLTKTKTHKRVQETEQREAKDWRDISTPESPDPPSCAFYGNEDQGKTKCRENSGKRCRYTERTGARRKKPFGQNNLSETQRETTKSRMHR